MNDRTAVSIVMIFLNEEEFINEAIDSVLAQTTDEWELVLVDDGSVDRSTEIARQYTAASPDRVRYVDHPDHVTLGMSTARNLGIRHSTGEYITFLDADDTWEPTKLAAQLEIARGVGGVEVLASPALWWYEWAESPEPSESSASSKTSASCEPSDFVQDLGVATDRFIDPPALLLRFLRDEWASLCDILVRRDVVESVGGYDDSCAGMFEDQVFHTKLCSRYPVYVTSQHWYRYRQHAGASTARTHSQGAHPEARRKFLEWLNRNLPSDTPEAPVVRRALKREFRSIRRPLLRRAVSSARRR